MGLSAIPGAAIRAPLEIELIVERGAAAPGVPGAFLAPGAPLLDGAGALAFEASLFDSDDLYLGGAVVRADSDGSLELVVKEGDPAPAGGGTIEQVALLGFNRSGQLLLRAVLEAPFEGLRFFGPGPVGPLDLLAYDGGPAPGLEPGDVFYLIAPPYLFGDDGSFAFESLAEIDGVVSTANWGFWQSRPDTGLEVLLLPGDPAPGIPGRTVSGMFDPTMDEAGSLAFFGLLDPGDGLALFVSDGLGGFTPALFSDDPAPGVPDARICFARPALAGDVLALAAMLCELSSGATQEPPFGVWGGRSEELALLARQGEQPPGFPPGYAFGNEFGTPLPSVSGAIAFTASVTGQRIPPDFDRGLWVFDPQTGLRLVAFPGMRLPDRRRAILLSVQPIGINSRGDVAFTSELSNGGRGLHLVLAGTGGFLTVVAKGDVVELSPGRSLKVKNVFTAEPLFSPPGPGARVFDDERHFAFQLDFGRGRSAALLARPVPEPSRPLLMLVGAVALGLARARAAPGRSARCDA